MILKDLGLMTFQEASQRWNKEKSYVRQMFSKYPNKFKPGTTIKIGNGKGTYIITREGMEYLTGQTEVEAAGAFLVVREKNNVIDYDKKVVSENQATEEIMQLLAKEKSVSSLDVYRLDYLDYQKKLFGLQLASGTKIYFKRI